jgi:hypothetical protein
MFPPQTQRPGINIRYVDIDGETHHARLSLSEANDLADAIITSMLQVRDPDIVHLRHRTNPEDGLPETG